MPNIQQQQQQPFPPGLGSFIGVNGVSWFDCLQLIFLVLKLGKVVTWSWWIILSPLFIFLLFTLIPLCVILIKGKMKKKDSSDTPTVMTAFDEGTMQITEEEQIPFDSSKIQWVDDPSMIPTPPPDVMEKWNAVRAQHEANQAEQEEQAE